MFESIKRCLSCFKTKDRALKKCETKINEELDIINLIQTLKKLKAGLAAVISNDNYIMKKAKLLNDKQRTVASGSEKENIIDRNEFFDFI